MQTKLLLLICCAVTVACTHGDSAPKSDPQPPYGTNYYVDAAAGDDANDGLSPDRAWRTLKHLRHLELQAGDSLLLKRGSLFQEIFDIRGTGTARARVVVDAYGEGDAPCIKAPDSSAYAVRVRNSDYLTLQNLEVINTGSSRMAGRCGVWVLCEEYGVSHDIHLRSLHIHDVNGTLAKHSGEGCGILITNQGREVVSRYDGLLIEHCIIRRCERNGINWQSNYDRRQWHPNTNTVVRYNLLEEVPGDGIVPIGCDGALIEYNLMRDCTDLLPEGDAAAGIWPWSSDNTIIQFNEVSDHKAPWDGQGFDCDFNCANTVIRYNYSHDNNGGFILICCPGPSACDPTGIIGNIGSLVQYNISINDALRKHPTREGMFSPTIHIGGPAERTRICNNILHANRKPNVAVDRRFIASTSWGGYSNDTWISGNVFYAPEPLGFDFSHSTDNRIEGNYYLGETQLVEADSAAKRASRRYERLIRRDRSGYGSLSRLMRQVEIADGAAHVTVVDKEAIEKFFRTIR